MAWPDLDTARDRVANAALVPPLARPGNRGLDDLSGPGVRPGKLVGTAALSCRRSAPHPHPLPTRGRGGFGGTAPLARLSPNLPALDAA